MPVKEITEKTHLVVDNCVLSMMTEWFCTENRSLPCPTLLEQTHNWLQRQIALFQSFTVEGTLHTSTSVSAEYKPWHDSCELRKRGVEIPKIQAMANSICCKFTKHEVNDAQINALRTLPAVNPKIVKKLTDQDLSLVQVGLCLSASGKDVYILTNDQDLLSYISWARTQKCLRNEYMNSQLLEGLSGLTFMDLVHRGCYISSPEMLKMISYVIADTSDRMLRDDPMALGKEKGRKIITDATSMLGAAFYESMQIKLQKQQGIVA